MKDKNEKTFHTSDFYYACLILAKGHKLLSVDKSNSQRISFIFKDFENRGNLLNDFIYGNSVVNTTDFISAIKTLKQVLHSND